ncbi:MAG: transposase family protein [Phycisphaeraceae bacterium]
MWNGVHALCFDSLLPAADRIVVESLRIAAAKIEVDLRCSLRGASCPICQAPSRRIHSRYVRVVRDLPWGGTPMVLRFSTRRFFCDNAACQRRIFAEELPDLARRRARGTSRLDETLVQVGLECGGEPGRRLCGELGIDTSGDTILRRLRAAPPASGHAGSVIGIDDFAFRRGQRYGTIVGDHESGEVIDLLADRTSACLEAWLAARPAPPTLVTRDRSGVYPVHPHARIYGWERHGAAMRGLLADAGPAAAVERGQTTAAIFDPAEAASPQFRSSFVVVG